MLNLNAFEYNFVRIICNKLLTWLSNFVEKKLFLSEVISCWISIAKCIHYPSVNVHLRNSNNQQLILAKFYDSIASFIGNQSLLTQTIVTVARLRLPQNTSVWGLCAWMTSDATAWIWSVLEWSHKSRCNYRLL